MTITMVSEDMAPKCDWEVVNDFSSDHLPIIVSYNLNNCWVDQPKYKVRWNFTKTNWKKFENCCAINHQQIRNNNIDVPYVIKLMLLLK